MIKKLGSQRAFQRSCVIESKEMALGLASSDKRRKPRNFIVGVMGSDLAGLERPQIISTNRTTLSPSLSQVGVAGTSTKEGDGSGSLHEARERKQNFRRTSKTEARGAVANGRRRTSPHRRKASLPSFRGEKHSMIGGLICSQHWRGRGGVDAMGRRPRGARLT